MLSTLVFGDNFLFDDEFDSSSTLYECIMFSKICFGYILSYIGISELACSTSAYQLIGLYMSYRDLSWINFQLCNTFLCFVLGINRYTLCLIIAEAWNFKLHIYIYIYIYIKITNFIVCDRCEHKKITYFFIQIYFGTVFLRQCMCVCERYMLKI